MFTHGTALGCSHQNPGVDTEHGHVHTKTVLDHVVVFKLKLTLTQELTCIAFDRTVNSLAWKMILLSACVYQKGADGNSQLTHLMKQTFWEPHQ